MRRIQREHQGARVRLVYLPGSRGGELELESTSRGVLAEREVLDLRGADDRRLGFNPRCFGSADLELLPVQFDLSVLEPGRDFHGWGRFWNSSLTRRRGEDEVHSLAACQGP